MSEKYVIGVVGNPNCGKTTLFNALTGARQRVGNWPGVTVERKVGRYVFQGADFELVDLPGTYSLEVGEDSLSADEEIARTYVAGSEADLIVNIVDASNLERNLYLTAQLREMRVPMLVALNMMDVAEERGIELEVSVLQERLGCRFVPMVASKGLGVDELRSAVSDALAGESLAPVRIAYADPIEEMVSRLAPQVEARAEASKIDPRWLALRLLEGDALAFRLAGEDLAETTKELRTVTESALGDVIDISLADARYGFVNRIIDGAVSRKGEMAGGISEALVTTMLGLCVAIPLVLLHSIMSTASL